MFLFRAMQPDPRDGKPLVGTRRGMLGVRSADPTDLPPQKPDMPGAASGSDFVYPGRCEGMSTNTVRATIVPKRVEVVWMIDASLLTGWNLASEIDPQNSEHVIITPGGEMTLDEFQTALRLTRDAWVRVS